MDFLNLVREARSCRRFDETSPLSQEDIRWLLECARCVPSAGNAQQLRFISITHGPICDDLFTMTRWAAALKDWNGPQKGERPTAFIAVLMPEKAGDRVCFDVGITCQTIQLAATSRGWGACMILSFEHDRASNLLQIPSGMKIALLVGLGVAMEKRVIEPMPADGSHAYWRDSHNIHHVPKRSVDELLIAQF